MSVNGPIYDQVSEPVRPKRGRPKKNVDDYVSSGFEKDPNAPKRFKSSYICFSVAKQQEIKEMLGPDAKVTDVAKKIAESWKNLSSEDRTKWDDVAKADKERYMLEKATYKSSYPEKTGRKRAKKDPSAPKRPMSAFLYFSQKMRSVVKGQNPSMKNTEVSKRLGEMWKSGTDEDREPYVSREAEERGHYKIAISKWKEKHAAEQEALKKKRKEEAMKLKLAQQANLQNNLLDNKSDAVQHYGRPDGYEGMGRDYGMVGGVPGNGYGGQEEYHYPNSYPPNHYADPYAPPSNHYAPPGHYSNQYPSAPNNQYPPHQYSNPYGVTNQYNNHQYSHTGQYEQTSHSEYGNGYGTHQTHSSMPSHHYGMSQSQETPDKQEPSVPAYGGQSGPDVNASAPSSRPYNGENSAGYGGYQQNYVPGQAESYNYQNY